MHSRPRSFRISYRIVVSACLRWPYAFTSANFKVKLVLRLNVIWIKFGKRSTHFSCSRFQLSYTVFIVSFKNIPYEWYPWRNWNQTETKWPFNEFILIPPTLVMFGQTSRTGLGTVRKKGSRHIQCYKRNTVEHIRPISWISLIHEFVTSRTIGEECAALEENRLPSERFPALTFEPIFTVLTSKCPFSCGSLYLKPKMTALLKTTLKRKNKHWTNGN